MKFTKYNKSLRILLLLAIMSLSACSSNMVLLHSKGQIGLEQRSLILIALGLMLVVVIPAIVMTLIFTTKYHESNIHAIYKPNWSQSYVIECVVWIIPIIIIIFLSILTWKSTHALDPSKPIASDSKSVTIEVIALDWKWLFIYPEQGIATINEIVFPTNIPIKFNITSNSVMNAFFIPQLGSQVYAMAGMNSTLYLMAKNPGKYKGLSSNFSGHGFSGMKFSAIAVKDKAMFDIWVHNIKVSKNTLNTMEAYEKLAIPSEYHPIEYFSSVKPELFQAVIKKFINKEEQCITIPNKIIAMNMDSDTH